MPILPPISSPKDLEIIEKAPPAPILIFVIMDDRERLVIRVIPTETRMIIIAPPTPALPTTQGNLKKSIIPNIVRKVGTNTPLKVPKKVLLDFIL